MIESELVDALARRVNLAPADAQAVLTALATIACEQERRGEPVAFGGFTISRCPAGRQAAGNGAAAFSPSPEDVDELIAAASRHPLGLEFLVNGDLCAVAIMFRAHAFTVDAARDRLREDASITGS